MPDSAATPEAATPEAPTLEAALALAARALAAAGVESARREARLIAEHALGLSREAVMFRGETPIDTQGLTRLRALTRRRAAREPLAYVTGQREFWSLPFIVSPATLVPRPESETLVEAALAVASERGAPRTILDLGTGSGCLLLALLKEIPESRGLGLDVCPAAAAIAHRNARALGLAERASFVVGDWGAPLGGRFDAILCNPPYVEADALSALAPEITRHEPRRALSGGRGGLDGYRRAAPHVARLLEPGGFVCVELGAGMASAVGTLFSDAGLVELCRRPDLAGIERCAIFAHPNRASLLFETIA